MKNRQSFTTLAPKIALAVGLLLAGGNAAAYAAAEPEPQQAAVNRQVVSGVVTDETGEPLIGATVQIKGTKTAMATDIDGNFKLTSPVPDPVLVVSYVGCQTQEVAVKGRSEINITLAPSSEALDEVVVTALGIKRQTKALGYSVQDVKGDMLTEARENNIVNSLSGRIAGLQISSSGSGSAGSSRIIIRGNNSLGGNNEPLVVVDGVPINNGNGASGTNQWGGTDGGNGMNDINPDDIESISVLKGAAAAALYGARAGNGVLMITTKKGSEKKGLGVTFNQNVMIERPLTKPEMQNVYGQGTNGVYSGGTGLSWGPRMDGELYTDWTGQERPFTAYDNDVMDYLKTGVTTTSTVEAGYTADQGSFRATASYQYMDGVVPSNIHDKFNLNLRGTINLTKNLQFDAKVNYIKSKKRNLPELGASADGVMRNYLIMPRSVHYSDLAAKYDEYGNALRWMEDPSSLLNPYIAEDQKRETHRDRFIGFVSLNWDITPWLSVKVRHGEDFYWNGSTSRTTSKYPLGAYTGYGAFSISSSVHRERNSDALITLKQDNWWGSKFSGSLSFGGNLMYTHSESLSEGSGKLEVPDAYYIANGTAISASNSQSNKAVNSLYGLLSLSYGNWLYVDVTARNDWSSTLPKNHCSFFYPSVGVGLVISDLLREEFKVPVAKWISFAKLRASYAEVGNDTSPYAINNDYSVFNITPSGTLKGSVVKEVYPLTTLKPENIKSTELGVDFRAFNNRLTFDFTWYKKNATNQILTLPVTKTTGYSSRRINAGNIQNRGVEIVLGGTPVEIRDFTWNANINYTLNRNKIIELHPDAPVYVLGKWEFAQVIAREGGSYGDIIGYRYIRNENGTPILDAQGLPTRTDNMDNDNPLGNYLPKWTGSMNNTFRYKDFSLGFLLDLRVGGDIYMNSLAVGAAQGTTIQSLEGRDEWYAGTGGYIPYGVVEEVDAAGNVIYVPNTMPVNPQEYWSRVRTFGERHVYDGTNLRLRELTFGYSMPKKLLAKSPFTGVKLSFVARNLWIIYSRIPGGYDPESIVSTGNAGGVEHYSFPTMRSFGFNLNVSF